jgi:hypothetical protein
MWVLNRILLTWGRALELFRAKKVAQRSKQAQPAITQGFDYQETRMLGFAR